MWWIIPHTSTHKPSIALSVSVWRTPEMLWGWIFFFFKNRVMPLAHDNDSITYKWMLKINRKHIHACIEANVLCSAHLSVDCVSSVLVQADCETCNFALIMLVQWFINSFSHLKGSGSNHSWRFIYHMKEGIFLISIFEHQILRNKGDTCDKAA